MSSIFGEQGEKKVEYLELIYRDLGVACAVFAVLMALTYRSGYLSIAVSVLFIYAVFLHLYLSWKKSAA